MMESLTTTSTNENYFSKIVKRCNSYNGNSTHVQNHTARMKTLNSNQGSLSRFTYVKAFTGNIAVHLYLVNVWRIKSATFKKMLNLTKLHIMWQINDEHYAPVLLDQSWTALNAALPNTTMIMKH